jgi:hypothetical protein
MSKSLRTWEEDASMVMTGEEEAGGVGCACGDEDPPAPAACSGQSRVEGVVIQGLTMAGEGATASGSAEAAAAVLAETDETEETEERFAELDQVLTDAWPTPDQAAVKPVEPVALIEPVAPAPVGARRLEGFVSSTSSRTRPDRMLATGQVPRPAGRGRRQRRRARPRGTRFGLVNRRDGLGYALHGGHLRWLPEPAKDLVREGWERLPGPAKRFFVTVWRFGRRLRMLLRPQAPR